MLEWGSHCVDLCQWAADADDTAPVEYNPPENGEMVAKYADGVELILPRKGLAATRFLPGPIRRR